MRLERHIYEAYKMKILKNKTITDNFIFGAVL